MPRLFLSLVVLGCLVIPAKLNADDAKDYFNRGLTWEEKGEYDKAIGDYTEALRLSDPNDTTNMASTYNNRGLTWEKKGEYDKAIADCNRALTINPNNADTYNCRGVAWSHKGDYDKAIADFSQALAINRNDKNARCNRGIMWNDKGEYDKAFADFNQALAVNPNDARAYGIIAWLQATCPEERYRDGRKAVENANKAYQLSGGKDLGKIDALAAAYAEDGDFDAATKWGAKAIALAADETIKQGLLRSRLELYKHKKPYREVPKLARDHFNRGSEWLALGEYDKAIAHYDHAIRLDPNHADAYVARGLAYNGKGEYNEAIADCNEALRIDPKFAATYNSLAWLQATCADEKYRDGKNAVINAKQAYELTEGNNWGCIDTLAAAYAESGEFEKAKEWEAKAIKMATAEKVKEEYRSRLELYKQGKRYREELKKK